MTESSAQHSFFARVLNKIEYAGNKLPHPVTLFVLLAGIVLLLSWIFSGVSVVKPGTEDDLIIVENLLTKQGIQKIFTEMVQIFALFPPLGLVLVTMIGIGVAEHTGLITTALKVFVSRVPSYLLTFVIVVAGMVSSLAADAGYVVLIPLGAAVFYALGRHPLAGLAAAFAGVSGGFCANFIPTSLDPMLAAFTEPAAGLIDPTYTVNPLSNYYFMSASVPIVGLAGTWVTERIIVPRLGTYSSNEVVLTEVSAEVTQAEKKALRWTIIGVFAMLALLAYTIIPENGLFRGAIDVVTQQASLKPFYDSLIPILFIIFFVAGLLYGILSKTIKNDKDVWEMSAKSLNTMGIYIIIAFFSAQFIAYFNWSNLGGVMAVKGAHGLQAIGLQGIPLMISFIIVVSAVNIVMGSASAKWALLAPIFVPMFMLMGISPESTMAAYRIGDSFSNIITPIMPYFPLIIVFARKYVPDTGIGTLIAIMLPYSIAIMIVQTLLFIVWILFEIPLGIEGVLFYVP